MSKQAEHIKNSKKEINNHDDDNCKQEKMIKAPLVQCDIDWIKEGEKFMDQKREYTLKQNDPEDDLFSPEDKEHFTKNIQGVGKF